MRSIIPQPPAHIRNMGQESGGQYCSRMRYMPEKRMSTLVHAEQNCVEIDCFEHNTLEKKDRRRAQLYGTDQNKHGDTA